MRRLAGSRRPDLDPDFGAALAFLRARTPADAVVASTWERGFEIQTYAARPAMMDGLLESVEVQRRIMAFARAAMDPAPDSLAAVCRRYGAAIIRPRSSQALGDPSRSIDSHSIARARGGCSS